MVVMGRRGCRAVSRPGILSGGTRSLHWMGTTGGAHGGGVTQRGARGEGGRAEPVPF